MEKCPICNSFKRVTLISDARDGKDGFIQCNNCHNNIGSYKLYGNDEYREEEVNI